MLILIDKEVTYIVYLLIYNEYCDHETLQLNDPEISALYI